MHNHCINKLLNLKDVKVTKILQTDHFLDIYIETEPSLHKCPACGAETKLIHDYDYHDHKITDLSFQI
ncbi:transposase [Anaerosporobacter faecicola]|uniref:transposase n=1 Tax=Anaerosporobacter faecicola TaxID=2718714 RepID=UPI00143A7FE7|nr:transposase [Anaerosporobacter faecicola]